jgi:hypothetical protein
MGATYFSKISVNFGLHDIPCINKIESVGMGASRECRVRHLPPLIPNGFLEKSQNKKLIKDMYQRLKLLKMYYHLLNTLGSQKN